VLIIWLTLTVCKDSEVNRYCTNTGIQSALLRMYTNGTTIIDSFFEEIITFLGMKSGSDFIGALKFLKVASYNLKLAIEVD